MTNPILKAAGLPSTGSAGSTSSSAQHVKIPQEMLDVITTHQKRASIGAEVQQTILAGMEADGNLLSSAIVNQAQAEKVITKQQTIADLVQQQNTAAAYAAADYCVKRYEELTNEAL